MEDIEFAKKVMNDPYSMTLADFKKAGELIISLSNQLKQMEEWVAEGEKLGKEIDQSKSIIYYFFKFGVLWANRPWRNKS